MSTTLSVEDAKKQLRQARLADHKRNIEKHLRSGNDKELAKACSSFKSMFDVKKPSKAKPSD